MKIEMIKWIHILSATVLFGTGLGTAYYKWAGDRLTDVVAIAQINRLVVQADWIFTTPAILLQAITGVLLVYVEGHHFWEPWLIISIGLFLFLGACWLPVVYLQIRMHHLSNHASKRNRQLPTVYYQLTHRWFWLGVPAFTATIAVFYLMVAKPLITI